MKKRLTSEFIKIVQKSISAAPAEPVRMDVSRDELDAVRNAYNLLSNNGKYLDDERFRLQMWNSGYWSYITAEIYEKETWRVAFFGPDYIHPSPIEAIPAPLTITFDSDDHLAFVRDIERKCGPAYKVQLDGAAAHDHDGQIFHISFNSLRPIVVKNKKPKTNGIGIAIATIWRGNDWMQHDTAYLWPAEIPSLLITREICVRRYEPLAKKGEKMVNVQKARREIKSEQCALRWSEWQVWIDAKRNEKDWSLKFAQGKAAEHFRVSLKTMQRRTV
jgi:hypothetical protein